MGTDSALGIDFGTSNTSVAVSDGRVPRLVAVEDERTSIPSAVFFNFETHAREFGRRAIQSYIDGHDGRFMRALKSILGTQLMNEATYVRGVRTTYTDILSSFIAHLKAMAEAATEGPLHQVVAGRPVHFVDDDPTADRAAEETLREIYRLAGFDEVVFQYEPIAAALDYERQVNAEQIVLIADLGGGTADFSLVRVSPQGQEKIERSDDILATSGVHVGGTDFDRLISLDRVMPLLGMGSAMRRDFAKGTLTVPRHIFYSLSTWQQIHRLYDRAVIGEVHDYRRLSLQPELIERLLHVLEDRLGHRLILSIEAAKIGLTDEPERAIVLDEVERGLSASITVEAFNRLIDESAGKITAALQRCVRDAGVPVGEIEAVFFTGGTAAIPHVRECLMAHVPAARVVDGDRFGSVGVGLALEAQRVFA